MIVSYTHAEVTIISGKFTIPTIVQRVSRAIILSSKSLFLAKRRPGGKDKCIAMKINSHWYHNTITIHIRLKL